MEKYLKDSQNSSIKAIQVDAIKFNNDILQFQPFIPIIVIFILLETFQTISTGLIPSLQYQSLGIDILRTIANILYPDYYLRTTNIAPWILIVLFLITITHLLLTILSYQKYKQKKQSRLNLVIHYGTIILLTFIMSPLLLVSASVLVCNQDNHPYLSSYISPACYTEFHGFLSFLAVLMIAYYITFGMYLSIFYFDPKPFTIHYFSSPNSLYFLGKLVIKLAPAIFIVVDPDLQFDVLFIVMNAGLELVYIGIFYVMWPTHKIHTTIDNIEFRGHILSLFVLLSFIAIHFLHQIDRQNLILIGFLIAGLFSGHYGYRYREFKMRRTIQRYLNEKIEADFKDQYDNLISSLVKNVQQSSQKQMQSTITPQDLLKIHQMRCNIVDCYCKQIKYVQMIRESEAQKKIYSFLVIKCMVQEICQSIKNSLSLEIISHQIDFYHLNLQNRTIFELANKVTPKINLAETVSITNLCYQFTKFSNRIRPTTCAVKNLQKKEEVDENKQFNFQRSNIYKYKIYYENLLKFQSICVSTAQLCIHYWNEIIQQDCEINNILRLARLISNQKQKIEEFYQNQLLSLQSNNKQTLFIYLQIMISAFRVHPKKLEYFLKKYQQLSQELDQKIDTVILEEVQLKQNTKTVTLWATQKQGNFEFIRVSSNIYDQFRWMKNQIIQKQIQFFLPEALRNPHKQKVNNLLKKPDSQIKNITRKIYIKNGLQEIVKAFYLAKIVPSFTNGIEIVCFLQKQTQASNNCHFLFYLNSLICCREKANLTGSILQVDSNLKKILLGQLQTSSKELNITDLLPGWCVYGEQFSQQNNLVEQTDECKPIKMATLIETIKIDQDFQMKILKIEMKDDSYGFGNFQELYSNSSYKVNRKTIKIPDTLFKDEELQGKISPNIQDKSTKYYKKILYCLLFGTIFCGCLAITDFILKNNSNQSISKGQKFNYHLCSLSVEIATLPVFIKYPHKQNIQQNIKNANQQLELMREYQRNDSNNIQVTMEFIESSSKLKKSDYKLPDAILLYLSKVKQIHEIQNDAQRLSQGQIFFPSNTLSIQYGLEDHLQNSSDLLDYLLQISVIGFVLGVFKILLVILVFVCLWIWLRYIGNQLKQIVSKYQNDVEACYLLQYHKLCTQFINIIQRRQIKQIPSAETKPVDIFNIEALKNDFNDSQTNKQLQQQRMLQKLRNQIKFQEKNSIRLYVKISIIILLLGILINTIIIANHPFFLQNQFDKRKCQIDLVKIMLDFDQFLYMVGFQPNISNHNQFLVKAERQLENSIYQYQLENKIDLEQTIGILSLYRGNFQAQQSQQFFSRLYEQHKVMHKYLKSKTIQSNDYQANSDAYTQILVAQISLHIMIFVITNFFVIQQGNRIISGIFYMKQILPLKQ